MAGVLLFLSLLFAARLGAEDRTIDPTWLHRYVPTLKETQADLSSPRCHFISIFGAGNKEDLRSVSRFAEVTVDPTGDCPAVTYSREEEILFVLQGTGALHYDSGKRPLRANDFTYIPPGIKHSLANGSAQPMRVLVMGFKIPARVPLGASDQPPAIFNLQDIREETVQGHPSSVLYKLLVGPKTEKRDAIDAAYVVTSFFSMHFAPGGTNFPHHHETAEEIYLVVSGEGEMVAGSGQDGIEARFPAKAGDAYYFRPNCTVGFYNQNKPGAEAYILAVRSRIPLSEED